MNRGTFDDFSRRMLSRPVGVVWVGWESNTLRLQQAGWDLAVEYDPHRDMYRLLVHSRHGKLWGMSNATHLDKRLASAWNEDMPNSFAMTGLANSLEVITEHHMGEVGAFANFQQIDATPQFVDRKIERVEDFNIFQTVTQRADEIIIEKADMSVVEHLEAIKALQSASQEEIRGRMLDGHADRDASPDVQIHTNIVQLRPAS